MTLLCSKVDRRRFAGIALCYNFSCYLRLRLYKIINKLGGYMGFYFRKSLRAGPFRFSLSKSGIGVSTGFTGFRVGMGPRGNYVSMGRNGLSYKSTLPSGMKSSQDTSPRQESDSSSPPTYSRSSSVKMEEIESVDVLHLRDSSSADLLSEMNSKHKKLQLMPIAVVATLVLILFSFSLNLPGWTYAIMPLIAGTAIYLAYRQDQIGKTVILFYELDGDTEKAFQSVHDAFDDLVKCAEAWHITSSGVLTDANERKRQAGASSVVKRNTTHLSFKSPPYVSTNISTPAVPVGRQTLYVFPDRILIYESGMVGAISYYDLQLKTKNTRFIEDESPPKDAQIVGQTWKYVNKSGGPDKRFKDNRQLPIALYSELHFQSKSGLNELIQVSKSDIGPTLEKALKELASIQQANQVQAT